MGVKGTGGASTPLCHEAFFYRGSEEYLAGTLDFIHTAFLAGESVLVMVPGDKIELIRGGLDGETGSLRFVDMTEAGRNPARIIPAQRQFFSEQAGPAGIIGEPIWPGRKSTELIECYWHESLINLAFGEDAARILCPYDADALDESVIADAWRSHPLVREGRGEPVPSAAYCDPQQLTAGDLGPLTAAPAEADAMLVAADRLPAVRALIHQRAGKAGLTHERADDLLLAAIEAATNSIRYATGPALLRVWQQPDALVCEVSDTGHITDVLAGRRIPRVDQDGQRGLWLINQLCDLVQIRSTPVGTVVRMSMRTP